MIPRMLPRFHWPMLVLFWLFYDMAFGPPLILTLIQPPVLWLQTVDQRLKPGPFLGAELGRCAESLYCFGANTPPWLGWGRRALDRPNVSLGHPRMGNHDRTNYLVVILSGFLRCFRSREKAFVIKNSCFTRRYPPLRSYPSRGAWIETHQRALATGATHPILAPNHCHQEMPIIFSHLRSGYR